jgi:hypothetical protein
VSSRVARAAEERLFQMAARAETDPRVRARLIALIRGAMRASIAEGRVMGSDRLFRAMKGLALRWARWRAPRLQAQLGLDPARMDSLAALQDWEDRVLGVEGHWPERGPRVAIKHETACPFVDLAARDVRFCTDLVHALETESFRALAPRYRLVPLDRLLSRGDAYCVFRHELPLENGLTRTPDGPPEQ